MSENSPVLVFHQWRGLEEYEKKRAEMLAGLGSNAFAADIYGKGIRPRTRPAAAAEAGKYRNNRPLLRARVRAALEVLTRHDLTDPRRIAAIGYCFGGTAALELARSGADIAGVVSFHGGSPRQTRVTPGTSKPRCWRCMAPMMPTCRQRTWPPSRRRCARPGWTGS